MQPFIVFCIQTLPLSFSKRYVKFIWNPEMLLNPEMIVFVQKTLNLVGFEHELSFNGFRFH